MVRQDSNDEQGGDSGTGGIACCQIIKTGRKTAIIRAARLNSDGMGKQILDEFAFAT